jgi:hypothetical protein
MTMTQEEVEERAEQVLRKTDTYREPVPIEVLAHSSLTAVFTLFDSNGKYIHGQQNEIKLDYPNETLAARVASGVNIKSEFDAKPGHYFVRLVVRDDEGQMSATSKAADVP